MGSMTPFLKVETVKRGSIVTVGARGTAFFARPGALQTEAQTPASWHLPATQGRCPHAPAVQPRPCFGPSQRPPTARGPSAPVPNSATTLTQLSPARVQVQDTSRPPCSLTSALGHPSCRAPRPHCGRHLSGLRRYLPEQKELPGAIATVDSSVRQRAARLHRTQAPGHVTETDCPSP